MNCPFRGGICRDESSVVRRAAVLFSVSYGHYGGSNCAGPLPSRRHPAGVFNALIESNVRNTKYSVMGMTQMICSSAESGQMVSGVYRNDEQVYFTATEIATHIGYVQRRSPHPEGGLEVVATSQTNTEDVTGTNECIMLRECENQHFIMIEVIRGSVQLLNLEWFMSVGLNQNMW